MRNLREKLKKQGGFTLIEMLIVVAIIAILVAVSIPFIANAMDKTRHATDAANERAAKAEIMVQYMAGGDAIIADADGDPQNKQTVEANKAYAYDAQNGILSLDEPQAYGQCIKADADRDTKFIILSIDANGQVSMAWATAIPATGAVTAGTDLCTQAVDYQHTAAGSNP